MPPSLALHIQNLGGFQDQTLVIAHISGLQNGTGRATAAEVRGTFDKIDLPAPAKVSNYLSKLAGEHLLVPKAAAAWALTPRGKERIRELVESASDRDLASIGQEDLTAANLGTTPQYIIPHELAPLPFRAGVAAFVQGHAFENNIFGISRFPREGLANDPIPLALDTCRETCFDLGLEYHLASDRTVEDLLFSNVAAAMWACRYGIALVEDTANEGVNYNVAIEVGAMLIMGRPCLLLKDKTVNKLPTDLIGHIYEPVDITQPKTIKSAIRKWATDRIGN